MNDQQLFARRLRNYLYGGAVSLITTFLAFWLVATEAFGSFGLRLSLIILALTQTAIQLFAFMHISEEKEPRWERFSLIFTILTMAIIIVGSLWVMFNLNYNMGMTPDQMQDYMIEQNKKGF